VENQQNKVGSREEITSRDDTGKLSNSRKGKNRRVEKWKDNNTGAIEEKKRSNQKKGKRGKKSPGQAGIKGKVNGGKIQKP